MSGTAGTAVAQGTGGTTGTGGTGGTTGTAALTADDFLIRIEHQVSPGNWAWFQTNTIEWTRFFSRARCVCNEQVHIRVDLNTSGQAKVSNSTQGTFKVLVGPTSDCISSNSQVRANAGCYFPDAGNSPTILSLKGAPYIIPVGMRRLFQAKTADPTDAGCSTSILESVYLWVDTTLSGQPDSALSDGSAPTQQLPIDGLPPPEPSGITVRAGGEALQVAWDELTGVPDLAGGGYVVFCARGGTLPVFKDPQYSGGFDSTALRCPGGSVTDQNDGGAVGNTDGGVATGGSGGTAGSGGSGGAAYDQISAALTADPNGRQVPAPDFFNATNPTFECSPLLTTGRSARIEGLENGVDYLVGVAAVDKTGNASPITKAYLQQPVPTIDFYRGYRADGGQADGGFCTVGGKASRSLAALTALAAAVVVWRSRRRRSK